MKTTACPLDCYDACAVVVDRESLKMTGVPDHPYTRGALCPHLNRHFPEAERILTPRVDGKEVTMQAALEAVADAIKEAGPEKFLLYRGSGNVGLMQRVTETFTALYGGWTTDGSLCDGSGQAGVEAGRGVSLPVAHEALEKAQTVIVWGRNASVTNRHILPMLAGKKVVVIDPVRTELAKQADLFLQIRPRSDFYLATLISRFLYMEEMVDEAYLENRCEDGEWYEGFLRKFMVNAGLKKCGITLDDLGDLLYAVKDRRTVILVGTGVQKYSIGDQVLQAIDGIGALMGWFGKEGCGIDFLGDSMAGLKEPFAYSPKKVAKPDAPFGRFTTVLVQGANPLAQMPGGARVRKETEQVKNLIYFGLYENETSERARIVLPAKTFLEKEDLRLSYAHPWIQPMPTVKASEIGISEYGLTRYLCEAFGLTGLKGESDYISAVTAQCDAVEGRYRSPAYRQTPYAEGFETDSGRFEFLEEFEDDFDDEIEGLWLITPKSPRSLNSQFRRESHVYVHPAHGFREDERVRVVSEYGEVTLPVGLHEGLREDCVLIYSGTPGVNDLTPPIKSLFGKSACYQEVKVTLERVS